MNKELCFKIENINLYLEQVLVDYIDIPIFFLCKSGKQYYISLCTNIDELNYIVVKLSMLDTHNLLHGKIAMRDVILKQTEFWNINSGEEIHSDKITKMEINSIDKNVLPEENACFEILTDKIKNFVQEFDSEFLKKEYFREIDKKVDFKDLDIELSCNIYYEEIEEFQVLLDYVVKKTLVSAIPSYKEEMNIVRVTKPKNVKKNDLFELSVVSIGILASAA